MLYEECIDKKKTIKKAKEVLLDYQKLLQYLDDEVYSMHVRSSWNIGEIRISCFTNPDTHMINYIDKFEKKNALQIKIINDVQKAVSKLEDAEIQFIYLTYVKKYNDNQIENELALSERNRRRLSSKAHLSFARSYGIEVIRKKQP